MANFVKALPTILQHEGGYVNDPLDPGGATDMGISLRYLRAREDADGDGRLDGDFDLDGDVDVKDILALHAASEDQRQAFARKIYKTGFWDPNNLDQIESQTLATKIFDMCVNVGNRQGVKLIQKAAGTLTVDGFLGPATINALNSRPWEQLLKAACAQQKEFYEQLIAAKPSRAKWRKGWIKRAAWPYKLPELGWTL